MAKRERAAGKSVEVVSTDGFLLPNAILEAHGLLTRKGFPESYDAQAFTAFLDALRNGQPTRVPIYSHQTYDILPEAQREIPTPDLVIIEGINALQPAFTEGKLDYRIAGLAAQVLYDELLSNGVRIFEYTPAYLHAKVALADDRWATVGSSNIDPLSLLLNLEANIVVRDVAFTNALAAAFERALAVSNEVTAPPVKKGWLAVLRRAFVAWLANTFLRLAGQSGRY